MTIKHLLYITIAILTLHASFLLLSGCAKPKSLTTVTPLANTDSPSKSEWQEITVSRPSYDKTMMLDFQGIKRQDGFTIVAIGMGRENQETFLCTGKFGEFSFWAQRWDIMSNEPTDTYIIYTKLSPPSFKGNDYLNLQLIRSHAKDIEAALLHFPTNSYVNYKPVKKVLFELNLPSHGSNLVRADDI